MPSTTPTNISGLRFYEAYLLDDWRISPKFTLDAGARWEYWTHITEVYGRLVNLDVAGNFRAVAPVVASNPVGALTGRTDPTSLIHSDPHAVQARIGFSWRPFAASSMAVRDGYGFTQHPGVLAYRHANGAAIPVVKESQRGKQRRQSAHSGERV